MRRRVYWDLKRHEGNFCQIEQVFLRVKSSGRRRHVRQIKIFNKLAIPPFFINGFFCIFFQLFPRHWKHTHFNFIVVVSVGALEAGPILQVWYGKVGCRIPETRSGWRFSHSKIVIFSFPPLSEAEVDSILFFVLFRLFGGSSSSPWPVSHIMRTFEFKLLRICSWNSWALKLWNSDESTTYIFFPIWNWVSPRARRYNCPVAVDCSLFLFQLYHFFPQLSDLFPQIISLFILHFSFLKDLTDRNLKYVAVMNHILFHQRGQVELSFSGSFLL